ncbi:MAG TPA: hypothetical protein VFR11_19535 [Micromonosporaceae bacterium]|nr:hypothetical protein [Micromonosporaceae bacterium]
MTGIRRMASALCLLLVTGAVAGCGFIAAGQKSISKPTTFVLIGHADVVLPASDHAAVGTTCEAPASITGVAENTAVKVLDAHGVAIANGLLGSGILARSGSTTTCAFPFQIPAVPGGSTTYQVMIGDRPAETFPASLLRQNAPAVLTITK